MNFEEIETLLETLTFIKETLKEWNELGVNYGTRKINRSGQ